MSEQRNLFIAVVLSMLVVFGWQFLIGGPGIKEEQARQEQQQQTAQLQNQTPAAPAATAAKPLPRDEAVAQSQARVMIDTPTLAGSINLMSGSFDDLKLKDYKETINPNSPQIDLLSPLNSEHPYLAEFGWVPLGGAPAPGADVKWTVAQGGPLAPGHDVELTYDNGAGLIFTRRISVDNRYMFTIVDSVDNHGAQPVALSPYGLVLRGNPPVTQKFWVLHEGFVGVFGGTLRDPNFDTLAKDNATQKFDGQGGWAGITDKYWMAAAIPPQSEMLTGEYKAFDGSAGKTYQADYALSPRTVAPAGSQTVIHHLFAGAKIVDVVDSYRQSLGIKLFDYTVDWGTFWFLTRPIFIALDFIYRFVGNFGVAILIFTVLVKALFFPLANASYRAMSKMKKLQPEMERLRERFKEDKALQQQELMKLYSKEKVNPLAGCLPMVVQIPVFFSLYKMLVVTIDMRQAPFYGWIKDLSAPDPTTVFNFFGLLPYSVPTTVTLPLIGIAVPLMIGVLPLIMGMTMWVQTNLNPPPADPTQQKIFGFMPIIFTFMLAGLPAGLVLYWAWNNFLSIIQQVVIMKSTGTPIDFIDRLRGMGRRLKRGEAPEKPAGPPD